MTIPQLPDDSRWAAAMEEVGSALHIENTDAAADSLREALDVAAAFHPDDLRRAETLAFAAEVGWRRQDPHAVFSARLEQVAIIKGAQGEQHPDYAEALLDLAEAYYAVGKRDTAFDLFIWTVPVFARIGESHDGLRACALQYAAIIAAERAEATSPTADRDGRRELLEASATLFADAIPLLEDIDDDVRDILDLQGPSSPEGVSASSESTESDEDDDEAAEIMTMTFDTYAAVLRELGRVSEAAEVELKKAMYLNHRAGDEGGPTG